MNSFVEPPHLVYYEKLKTAYIISNFGALSFKPNVSDF